MLTYDRLTVTVDLAVQLACEVEGREFVPSAAAPPSSSEASRLRQPRSAGSGRASPSTVGNGNGNANGASSRSGTPVSSASNVGGVANSYATSQKAANEDFFAGLGAANASRSADLHPSQGGRYAGFGNTPAPSSSSSSHPSSITSSRALPSLNDLQSDPVKALSKGWGFFSSTVSQATKTINESIVQPGMARAADPDLQQSLYGYVQGATKVLGEGARKGSEMLGDGLRAGSGLARQNGLDVGDLGAGYVDRFSGGRTGGSSAYGNGYAPMGSAPTSLDYQAAGRADGGAAGDDFFDSQLGGGGGASSASNGSSTAARQGSSSSSSSTPAIQSAEQGLAGMSLAGNAATGGGVKRPLGKKGLGSVKTKATDDDDDWGKFD